MGCFLVYTTPILGVHAQVEKATAFYRLEDLVAIRPL